MLVESLQTGLFVADRHRQAVIRTAYPFCLTLSRSMPNAATRSASIAGLGAFHGSAQDILRGCADAGCPGSEESRSTSLRSSTSSNGMLRDFSKASNAFTRNCKASATDFGRARRPSMFTSYWHSMLDCAQLSDNQKRCI